MQAIVTRYFGPTNFRGSRIKATCEATTIFPDYDDGLDLEGNHDAAARALIVKLGWNDGRGGWVRGTLPKSAGNVYTLDSRKYSTRLSLPRPKKVAP